MARSIHRYERLAIRAMSHNSHYIKYVPHDTAKLIDLQGGVEKFVERLDWIFDNVWWCSRMIPVFPSQPTLRTISIQPTSHLNKFLICIITQISPDAVLNASDRPLILGSIYLSMDCLGTMVRWTQTEVLTFDFDYASRFWCHGKLRVLLSRWTVSPTGDEAISPVLAVLPLNLILQPFVQHHNHDC